MSSLDSIHIDQTPFVAFLNYLETFSSILIEDETEKYQTLEAVKENIERILTPNQSTLIADDYSMFNTTTGLKIGFAFELNSLLNIKASGRVFAAVHYIGDAPLVLEDCMIISDIDFESSSERIINFHRQYYTMALSEEEKYSEYHTLMVTVLVLEQEGEEYFVNPYGFSFIPLSKVNRSFVQGMFQLPIYTERMNSYIYELMQHVNPWAVVKEIENNNMIRQSRSSLVLRVKLAEYDGWLEIDDSYYAINRMFLNRGENYEKLSLDKIEEMLDAPEVVGHELNEEEENNYDQMIAEYFRRASGKVGKSQTGQSQQQEFSDSEQQQTIGNSFRNESEEDRSLNRSDLDASIGNSIPK